MSSVMTVRGPIAPEELGFTSLHEHILVDLAECYRNRYRQILPNVEMPDGPFAMEDRSTLRHAILLSSSNLRLDDEEAAAGEVADFRTAGGSAIVETGAPGIRTAEDVRAFQRISEKTGVHIVACTGLYAEDSWPEHFQGLTQSSTRPTFERRSPTASGTPAYSRPDQGRLRRLDAGGRHLRPPPHRSRARQGSRCRFT
jgi:phosphotriesterase-related protein